MVKENVEEMGQTDRERIILDTSVCIEVLNGRDPAVLSQLSDADAFLSSVTVFELMLRRDNLDTIDVFVSAFKILDFEISCARKASEIAKDLKARGMPIDSRDIFIAAAAITNRCRLATLNHRDFSRIKGLNLIKL